MMFIYGLTHVLYAVTENSCNDCELQAAAMEGEGSSERLAALNEFQLDRSNLGVVAAVQFISFCTYCNASQPSSSSMHSESDVLDVLDAGIEKLITIPRP